MNRKSFTIKSLFVLGLLTVGLVFSGCNSKDKTKTTETTPPSSTQNIVTTPTPTPPPPIPTLKGPLPSNEEQIQLEVAEITEITLYVKSDTLNIRKGPNTEHGIVGKLEKGMSIKVNGKTTDNGWYRTFDGFFISADSQYTSDTPIA